MQYILLLAVLLGVARGGAVCENPKIDATGYTTTDATYLTKIAYISDFTLTCSNGAQDVSLYAEIDNSIVNVGRSVDGLKYQVSWVADVDSAPSGAQEVKLYDDIGYSALKKAQRSGESTSDVDSIASISIYHTGAYRGPWIQSETVAVVASIVIFYYALTQKNIIVE